MTKLEYRLASINMEHVSLFVLGSIIGAGIVIATYGFIKLGVICVGL